MRAALVPRGVRPWQLHRDQVFLSEMLYNERVRVSRKWERKGRLMDRLMTPKEFYEWQSAMQKEIQTQFNGFLELIKETNKLIVSLEELKKTLEEKIDSAEKMGL